jgi:hypothetical protein
MNDRLAKTNTRERLGLRQSWSFDGCVFPFLDFEGPDGREWARGAESAAKVTSVRPVELWQRKPIQNEGTGHVSLREGYAADMLLRGKERR